MASPVVSLTCAFGTMKQQLPEPGFGEIKGFTGLENRNPNEDSINGIRKMALRNRRRRFSEANKNIKIQELNLLNEALSNEDAQL